MSATRLLILGVLRQWQPTHGYNIRQWLESWHADEWANVAFGSIYFALRKMAEEGLVETVDEGNVHQPAKQERGPARVTYVLTERGEDEFQRLLREHFSVRKPLVDPFIAALAFMPSLPEDELLDMLRRRVAAGRRDAGKLEAVSRSPEVWPPYVAEIELLTAARIRAEVDWGEALIAKIESGQLRLRVAPRGDEHPKSLRTSSRRPK